MKNGSETSLKHARLYIYVHIDVLGIFGRSDRFREKIKEAPITH